MRCLCVCVWVGCLKPLGISCAVCSFTVASWSTASGYIICCLCVCVWVGGLKPLDISCIACVFMCESVV